MPYKLLLYLFSFHFHHCHSSSSSMQVHRPKMPATENQGSFLGRISIRRNQNYEQELEDLELFQKHIADRFSDLLKPSDDSPSDPLLSVDWLRKLVDTFLCCEAHFKAIVIMGRDPSQTLKPPLDRLLPDHFDRVLKALDICNAVIIGVESVRQFQKLAEIAVSALEKRPIGDGQVKRARKALSSLISTVGVEDKELANTRSTERALSFGRQHKDRTVAQFRSLPWSMPKGWSAAKQVQAISSNLVAPRGGDSSGLALPVYMMSTVMAFVMWTLVAAIPCQERTGLPTHFPASRQLTWAQPMITLHEKISEEWKKREKKGACGLMEEMQRMEKLSNSLMELTESFTFPFDGEKLQEVEEKVGELAETCRKMEKGLVPLRQQIREVFHRAVRSRTEVLEVKERSGKVTAPVG